MKATLEFDLPSQELEFKAALGEGLKWRDAAWEYSRWLRDTCKHGEPETVDLNAARDKFLEIVREFDLSLY